MPAHVSIPPTKRIQPRRDRSAPSLPISFSNPPRRLDRTAHSNVLCKAAGLEGLRPKRWRSTTDSAYDLAVAPNHLQRDFTVNAPDEVRVGDITYVRTWEGWLYLAAIVDLFSRRVVGWAAAEHMRTELVVEALEKAVRLRRPSEGLTFHSDRRNNTRAVSISIGWRHTASSAR